MLERRGFMVVNQNVTFNEKKFRQVLHYIISKAGSLDNVGKTVLYKMLYFLDFDFYELNEVSITGEKYFKLAQGPAPSDFDTSISLLEGQGKVEVLNSEYKGYSQIKFVSLCKPDLNLLNANELNVIEKVISKLSSMTASQVSGYSHGDMPWQATEENKEIDYELVFYRDSTFSVVVEDDIVC